MRKFVTVLVAAACLSALGVASAAAQSARSPGHMRVAQMEKKMAAPAVDQVDMSAVPDIERDQVRRAQRALDAKGFDPGPADGLVGPQTKKAIQGFQNRFGINASGKLDNQTLFALGIVVAKAPAAEKAAQPQEKAQPEMKAQPQEKAKPREKAKRQAAPPPKASRSSMSPARNAVGVPSSGWCANYRAGGRNCGFATLAQCKAAISGVGGFCTPK
jgi:peptidoglycan hydrolase-like protein with peptidoglycan-binding domain